MKPSSLVCLLIAGVVILLLICSQSKKRGCRRGCRHGCRHGCRRRRHCRCRRCRERFGANEMQPAMYKVQFESTWNPPANKVKGPHTGNLFFATHNPMYGAFKLGQPASAAIAHTSMFGTIDDLVKDARRQSPNIYDLGMAPVIKPLPGHSRPVMLKATDTHPLLTVTGMIAPSSDFFFGLDSFNLKNENGEWIKHTRQPVFGYDAGSDPANRFVNNQPGAPIRTHENITMLQKVPQPFGYVTIEKL